MVIKNSPTHKNFEIDSRPGLAKQFVCIFFGYNNNNNSNTNNNNKSVKNCIKKLQIRMISYSLCRLFLTNKFKPLPQYRTG